MNARDTVRKVRGTRVFATASGKEGVELVLEMGAHAAVDGKRTVDISDQVRQFAPDGVDAVLALAGGHALDLGFQEVVHLV